MSGCSTCKPDGYSAFNYGSYSGRLCYGCPEAHMYRDMETGICHACHSSCNVCSGPGPHQCVSCYSGLIRTAYNSCVQSCSTYVGYYFDHYGKNGGTVASGHQIDYTGYAGCKTCHSSCKTCSGGTANQCNSCNSGYFLLRNVCYPEISPGVSTCEDGYYFHPPSSSCQPCDSTCATCKNQPTYCLSCTSPMKLDPTKYRCIDSTTDCPVGYIHDESIAKCVYKRSNCIKFDVDNNYECTECVSGTILNSSKNCASYQTGLYYATGPPYKVAGECDSSCTVTCTGPTASDCSTCQYFLRPNGTYCSSYCYSNYYRDHTSKKCLPCHEDCYNCNGPENTNCTSCVGSKVVALSGECTAKCPDGQYAKSLDVCEACHSSCKTCRGPLISDCLSCDSDTYPNIRLQYNRCIDCGSDYILNGWECRKNWPTCETYSSQYYRYQSSYCSSCKSGYTHLVVGGTLDTDTSSPTYNQIINGKGYCIKTNTSSPTKCPPRYTKIGSGLQCRSCNQYCDCDISGVNLSTITCTACYHGYKFKYGYTNYCHSYCYYTSSSYGYYKYPLIGVNKCGFVDDGDCAHVFAKDPNCVGCNNKWDTHCPYCNNTSTHRLHNGHCYEKGVAVPGYYWSSSNYLYKCRNGCKVCNNSSYHQCSECHDNHSLKLIGDEGTLGNCVVNCPSGYSSVNKVCLHCHSNCKQCSAQNDEYACTSCTAPSALTPSPNRICDPNGCPDGYFIGPNQICETCNYDYCLTCFGSNYNNCLSCDSGKYLKTDNSECVVTCPSNYYYQGDKCFPCDPSCATCNNPTKTNCLTCNPGDLLQVDNSCQSSCISGTFLKDGTTTCVRCANLCDTCTSQAVEDCSTCSSVAFMLSTKACVGNCTVNWYEVDSTRNCERCHTSCLSCNGPSNTNCTACNPGVTFVAATHTCGCTFPGQYFDSGYCLPCHSTCDTCDGPLETNCITCLPTTYLIPETKKCTTKCPDGTYTSQNMCITCHEKCLTCVGSTEKDCSFCKSYYDYLSETQECISCENKEKLTSDTECSFVKQLELREETTDPDYYSSNTVEVYFSSQPEHKDFLNTLNSADLPDFIKASFSELTETDYKIKWNLIKNNIPLIRLMVNFTERQNNIKLQVKPLKFHWNVNVETNRSELSFLDLPTSLNLTGSPPEPASAVDSAGDFGNNMDGITGVMGIIGTMSVVLSVLSAGAPSGPIIQIIRLFKIFFRLRLVNSFFGTLLDFFLSKMGEMMKSSSYEFNDEDIKYFVKTRGKLTQHQITVFSTFVLYDKIMIYLLLKLFSITTTRIKANVSNPEKLTNFDYYYVKILDSFSTVLLLSGIYDFTLYCSHELLHHDLYIEQTSNTNVSYYQSMLCLFLVFTEIINMFNGIQKLDINLIERYEKKIQRIKDYIIDKKNTRSNRILAKARLNYYKRRYEYQFGAMTIYFTKGIKSHFLQKWTGRFYRFALLMKLIMFEILIVSLQMLPKTQLMFLTFAQFVVIIIIGKALFFDRIYSHKLFGFMDLITEATIFFYLIIGNMSTWIGEENIQRSFWTKIQLYEIYLILFTAGMNIIQVIYNACLSIYNLFQDRKYRVEKEKRQKKSAVRGIKEPRIVIQSSAQKKSLNSEGKKSRSTTLNNSKKLKRILLQKQAENSMKSSDKNKKYKEANTVPSPDGSLSIRLKPKKRRIMKVKKKLAHQLQNLPQRCWVKKIQIVSCLLQFKYRRKQ